MSTKCKFGCKNGRVFLDGTKTWVDCPECGATPINQLKDKITGVQLERYTESGIPEVYQNVGMEDLVKLFQHPTLVRSTKYDMVSVERVKGVLQDLALKIFDVGAVDKSYFIHLPFFLESDIYVYLLQRLALDKRLTVSPYVTLNSLNGLMRSSDYGVSSMKGINMNDYSNPEILDCIDGCKLANEYKVTYSDFIQSDLCILNYSANTSQRGINALADILSERSKRGKATIVIGYWGSKNRNSNEISYLLDDGYTRNKCKVLTTIEIAKKESTNITMENKKTLRNGKDLGNPLKNFTV